MDVDYGGANESKNGGCSLFEHVEINSMYRIST